MSAVEFQCGLVLLAAGASVRMGRPKQLLEISGRPLVRHCALAALASPARPIVVVLGSGENLIRPHLEDLPITVVVNPDWKEGMGLSLRFGVATLQEAAPNLEALVVALADHPHLSGELIRRLLEKQFATRRSIVTARTRDRNTPPVLFLRSHFAALLETSGDRGANSLLREHAEQVATVDVLDAADLDTPDDCTRYFGEK